MTVSKLAWVGIDAGKTAHHAYMLDDTGARCWSQKVPNDQSAVEQLVAKATARATEVRWAVDLTSSAAALLVAVLVSSGQRVVYIPGQVVNRMAGTFRGEAKTDAKDARVIAETARIRSELTEITTPDELVVELTRLTAHRGDLMADWVRGINRLRDLLTSIFPALEREFDYSARAPLTLVSGYCTPDEIRAAGSTKVTEYLVEHGAHHKSIPSLVDKAIAAARAQTMRLPGENTTAILIKRLARQLLDLDHDIKATDKLITQQFREHPQAAIIESLPGIGPILGAEFVVATGGTLSGFASSGRLASYAGLVPVPQDSGRVSGNLRRPKRYHRRLRRVFYMAALSSLRADGPSRTFYDKKRGERLIHTQALLALARRLVDVLWALLRDGRLFTPTAPKPATPAT